VTTALYRRYRPETFAEVIGQDHVTAPLRQALRSGQVNHAYLFSGPRGCGKTSSARILARVLNCAANTAEHPTDTPCGQCPSCVELATGGPGSLDVVEIDAASHGGVDDARELRERATFAPARDRFKVFILDEAHMVTPQGFNALLKIVEEPPAHVKFVFATTEPDKVIGTIRSRTHHYPFRLVAPDVLVPYLEGLCAQEEVRVGAGVLPLVVRAGAGSVRDSLSVLDQLVAGSGSEGLVYDSAVALLGYTPASLLDDLIEALAARDGAAAFRVVERVVDSGHEPRRFVEDLLERLRDLIVIAASGDAAVAVLRDLPTDQLDRMRAQAAHLGAAELSRSADLASVALTEMVGATSPRLQLELLAARLLLPAADDSTRGLGARVDRLERVVAVGGVTGAPALPGGPSGPALTPTIPSASPRTASPTRGASRAGGPPEPAPPSTQVERSPEPADGESAERSEPVPSSRLVSSPARSSEPEDQAAPGATRRAMDTEMLRRRWPEVLVTVQNLRKLTSALVADNALPLSLDDTTLRLGFTQQGHVNAFRSSAHAEVVARALRETLGVDVRVEAELSEPAGGAGGGGGAPAASAGTASVPSTIPTSAQAEASWSEPTPSSRPAPARPSSVASPTPSSAPESSVTSGPSAPAAHTPATSDRGASDRSASSPHREAPRDVEPPWDDEPPPDEEPPWDDAPAPRGRAASPSRPAPSRPAGPVRAPAPSPEPDEPSPDDVDLAGSHLTGAPLVAQMLGGQVIDEEIDDSR